METSDQAPIGPRNDIDIATWNGDGESVTYTACEHATIATKKRSQVDVEEEF
jgi:hypothetical protein